MTPKEEIEKINRQTEQIKKVREAIDPVRFLLDKCIEYIDSQAFRFPKKIDIVGGKPVIIEDGDPIYNTDEQSLIEAYQELTGEKVNAVS